MWAIAILKVLLYYPTRNCRSSLESYTSNNTTQHKTTWVQHDTTQVQHETIRVQHKTARLQNNLKFVLIYSYHRYILGAWYISLYSSVYVAKLRKLKIAFSSNSENGNFLRESFWVNLNCSRIFSWVSYSGKKSFNLVIS